MSTIQLNGGFTTRIQSPFLYCSAAGSTGADQSTPGIHTRWDLCRELGEKHLPKGNYAQTSIGYNRSDDFVRLYRATWNEDQAQEYSFKSFDCSQVQYLPNDEGIIVPVQANNWLIIRFLDRAQFRYILNRGLSGDVLMDFLKQYSGIIEIEVKDKLMFYYQILFESTSSTDKLSFETVSAPDRFDLESVQAIRREFREADSLQSGIASFGENIIRVRIKQNGSVRPYAFRFQTYEDFFDDCQQRDAWRQFGDGFSMTLDREQAFTWFQGYLWQGGELNLTWPKYNDGAMVVAENYRDRWDRGDGLAKLVADYIALSDNDPMAYVRYANEEDPQNPDGDYPNATTVSLLEMARLVALDYHVARFFGLGYLDQEPMKDGKQYFIYAAVYTTEQSIPDVGEQNDHIYMTIPTRAVDHRLPEIPGLDLTYGLYVRTDEEGEPNLISQPDGYSFYDYVRFINLNRNFKNEPRPVLPNIPVNDSFNSTILTPTFSFGVEYREAGRTQWQAPELIFDDEYRDEQGIPETSTTPNASVNPIFTHSETKEGGHEYALYSVNWFSRSSDRSAIQNAVTKFTKHNTLLPPFNLGVQYIQEEEPLIFTTQSEQDALAAAMAADPNGDHNRTRIMFEWDNLHNNAYQYGNAVEFYFRNTPIQKVEGKIKSVTSVSETECEIRTQAYVMTSANPALTVQPEISAGEEPKFVGALFCTPDGQYEVVSISQSAVTGEGPIIRVRKSMAREMVQPAPDEPMISMPVYTMPDIGNIFYMFENVSDIANWTKLDQRAPLHLFSNTTEDVEDESTNNSDPNPHTETVGGINGNALIEEISGSDGGYRITFDNGISLADVAPDSANQLVGVQWAKGSARFIKPGSPKQKKRLSVYAITQMNPVQIVVYDPTYLADPGARILTGTQWVNFHPGYRIYLNPESGHFGQPQIMPVGTANNRKTYLAARSVDTSMNYASRLTAPVTLVARNIQKPVAPQSASGPDYATRPDFYGKSTYTLDIKLDINNRVPYGVIVYRASDMAVLQALYKPTTLQQILVDLSALPGGDPFRFDRLDKLMNLKSFVASSDAHFPTVGGYAFPDPDNSDTTFFTDARHAIHPFPLNGTVGANRDLIQHVIEDVFVPLTEVPIVFEYVASGYQTSSRPPKIRDMVNRLLAPTPGSGFDPFPMAVRFPATNPDTLRFTDYTLEGSARNLYFYFAREVSLTMKLSERTRITRPVSLVNTMPAEKPVIRKVITQERDPVAGKPAAVQFELADYIDAENIRQFQVFRTTDVANTTSVRTMALAATVEVGSEVVDTFSDLAFPPYGQPLFYRIVALREIQNERDQLEMVPSQPSEMVLSSVIDVVNPDAPALIPTLSNVTTNSSGTVTSIGDVSLSWPQTAFNGTYSLYKMNDKGNWERFWTKKTNDSQIVFPESGDPTVYPQVHNLPKVDQDGNPIYHRYKVMVENASGLFNLNENPLVI